MARSAPALHACAALLGRAFARIAEAAADGRTFDRTTIVRCADIWDNTTFPPPAGPPCAASGPHGPDCGGRPGTRSGGWFRGRNRTAPGPAEGYGGELFPVRGR
ncbi:hypothetical protein ACFXAF_06665 [Kitasatospora sp. NPDC059463]|uniref:hypothetical protein n=1 Tax=unclassified Kitasatospora TaxID=2633591 RepID=UPI003687E19C